MATYIELLQAAEHDDLNRRIRVAVVIAAEVVRTENVATANHSARLLWAKSVFEDPDAAARRMLWPVLAQNAAAPFASIIAANDAQVQAAVNAAVNVFAI